MRKYHRLGRCNSRALFSHISGGWKSRGVGSFGFLQGLSLWLADGSLFTVSSPGLSPVCAHSWFLSGWPNPLFFLFFFFQIPFSYEDTSQMGLRLSLTASFSFNYLLRPYLKIWLHLDTDWDFNILNLRGHSSVHNSNYEKREKITSVGKDMDTLEPLWIVGRNVKSYSCCGKQ